MTLAHYVDAVGRLHTDHTGGRPRPHKATMLLCVISLAECGRLGVNRIEYSPRLLTLFRSFFEVVAGETDRCTPHNPFFHLRKEKFWHLHPQPGQDAVLKATRQVNGPGQLTELVAYASLDPELHELLAQPANREVLRQTLIDQYFPDKRSVVLALCDREAGIDRLQGVFESRPDYPASTEAAAVRDAAFSRTVCDAYDYTCALCGIRFILDDVILVDAAHLIPWSESQSNAPTNGIALCKNHHWLMDRYLVAPGPARGKDYEKPVWHVCRDLNDRLESHRACTQYEGQTVILPTETKYKPSKEGLDWRMVHLRQTGT